MAINETRVSVEQADLDKLLSDVDRYLHDKCADPVADELHTRLHEVAFALASSNRSEGEAFSARVPYDDEPDQAYTPSPTTNDPCDLAGHLGHEAAVIEPTSLLSSKVELLPSAREAMLESMASPTTNAGGERENEPVGNSDELARLREALEVASGDLTCIRHALYNQRSGEATKLSSEALERVRQALATKGGAGCKESSNG